jgi:NTP pyrophosphatase (non-canonical NTP hydrolase)
MSPNEYQNKAAATAIYPMDQAVVYPALGLVGEAGEVAEKIKKIIRSGRILPLGITGEEKREIAKELGDVLWYVSVLADELGFYLDEVMQMNLDKLSSRAQRNMLEGNGDNR